VQGEHTDAPAAENVATAHVVQLPAPEDE